jgi:hypothetical protein
LQSARGDLLVRADTNVIDADDIDHLLEPFGILDSKSAVCESSRDC